MRRKWRPIALSLCITLLFAGHSAGLLSLPGFSQLEAQLYDARVRYSASNAPDDRIVILDIDEKSLAEIGRWPWNRIRMAELIDLLFDQYGIAVLGFDIVWAASIFSLAQWRSKRCWKFAGQCGACSAAGSRPGVEKTSRLRTRPISGFSAASAIIHNHRIWVAHINILTLAWQRRVLVRSAKVKFIRYENRVIGGDYEHFCQSGSCLPVFGMFVAGAFSRRCIGPICVWGRFGFSR